MEFLLLAIAIAMINVSSNVLRTLFTTTHPSFYHHVGVSSLCSQQCSPWCVRPPNHCVNNSGHCINNPGHSVNSPSSQVVFLDNYVNRKDNTEKKVLLQYKKSELLHINRTCHTISDSLVKRLSVLGIRRSPCTCKLKKYKRGTRAGKHRQRSIPTIENVFPKQNPPSPPPVNKAKTENLIRIQTTNAPTNTPPGLKVIHLNAQSTREKTTIISDLIEEMDVDIAFITEIWLYPSGDEIVMQNLTPDSYTSVFFPRNKGKGGGIGIIHRQSLKIQSERLSNMTSFECCQCKLTISPQTVTFVCVYRPPPNKKNKFTTKQFVSEFQDLLDDYSANVKAPIFLGDFNFHYDNPSDTNVRAMLDILQSYLLFQVVDKPTHKHNHILDWVITDNVCNINKLQVHNKCISDHFIVSFEIPFNRPPCVKRTITCMKMDINHDRFTSDIQDLVQNIEKDISTNKLDSYNIKLRELLDHHAPLRSRTVTARPSAKWMTSEIKEAKSERRRAERKWRSTKLVVHKDIYKQLNTKVKHLIEIAKREMYSKQIEECATSKALFQVTDTICGKRGSTQSVFPKTIPADILSEKFANFFSDKITSIRTSLDAASSSPPTFDSFEALRAMFLEEALYK
ncbi:hypothetical protein EGW08_019933 [Elysia chlorotica]|uniref:Endonuclease/exonuclease/phosphatase domain-containing protein n=1 Tax=Elysia chlorotica TaxID=188477 RepID=A0A3S0Z987_ELYCH|nr:hypothetical protein EGW08_019933 [Elysia chlorotica]